MSDTVMVTVRIDNEVKARLLELCTKNGLKMRWVVERAIEEYCERHTPSAREG